MFHVGQSVVCVNDTPTFPAGDMSGLRKGRLYTIRQVGVPCPSGEGRGVHLEEIRRASGLPFREVRFRPVLERETDISVFTDILKRAPAELETTG